MTSFAVGSVTCHSFYSTALDATLVDEYGEDAPLLETGGRALREMTRISGSPYSMWRDVALTNKKNIRHALLNWNNAWPISGRSGHQGTGAGVRARASFEKEPTAEKDVTTETRSHGEG